MKVSSPLLKQLQTERRTARYGEGNACIFVIN